MVLTGTLFQQQEGRDLFSATFGEHSVKEYFPYLLEEGVVDEIEESLCEKQGITKIAVFDELGDSIYLMEPLEELTLLILPSVQEANDKGKRTRDILRNENVTIRKKYFPISLNTNEVHNAGNFATYFPTRNLIVAHINPFYDADGFRLFYDSVSYMSIEFCSPEDIALRLMAEQWGANFERTIRNKRDNLRNTERYITEYKEKYLECVSKVFQYKQELAVLEDIGSNSLEYVKSKIEELKELSFIKDIKISDRVSFTFGDIYCTGSVITGTDTEGNSIREARKVYIGELWFSIIDGMIVIENDDKIDTFEHPHAERGTPCYGNAEIEINRCIREFELVELAKYLYSWAFSYNADDSRALNFMQRFYQRQVERETSQQEVGE